MANFYELMDSRGLIESVSHEDELKKVLENPLRSGSGEPLSIYAGFDPTAKSLHAGHLVPLLGLRRAQDSGLRPIVLFGGATGLVGDPTGRTEMRQMNTPEQIAGYVERYRKMTAHYFASEGELAPLFLNNHDWLGAMSWIGFARDVGVHFTIARLLAADVNRSRYEAGGLTFLELGYQLLQAYDFLHLFREHNCALQLGGNDQWSNILAGADLIRRVEAGKAFALTFPLLTASDGSKLGKSAGNAIWLDPDLTRPYEFYQYFRNVRDDDIGLFARLFTFYSLEEIDELCDPQRTSVNAAKEKIATDVTALVHGQDEAAKALGAARALFSGVGAPVDAPSLEITADELEAGVPVLEILVRSELCKSKGEGRKLIEGRGLVLDGEKVTDVHLKIGVESFQSAAEIILRKGKKDYLVVRRA